MSVQLPFWLWLFLTSASLICSTACFAVAYWSLKSRSTSPTKRLNEMDLQIAELSSALESVLHQLKRQHARLARRESTAPAPSELDDPTDLRAQLRQKAGIVPGKPALHR